MSTTRPTDIDAFGQRYLSTLEHLDVKLELLRLKRTLSKGGGVMVMTCIRWSELNEVVAGDCDYHGTLQDFCHAKVSKLPVQEFNCTRGPITNISSTGPLDSRHFFISMLRSYE